MPKPLFIPNHHWFSLAADWKTGAGRILRLDVSLSIDVVILCSVPLDTRSLLSVRIFFYIFRGRTADLDLPCIPPFCATSLSAHAYLTFRKTSGLVPGSTSTSSVAFGSIMALKIPFVYCSFFPMTMAKEGLCLSNVKFEAIVGLVATRIQGVFWCPCFLRRMSLGF